MNIPQSIDQTTNSRAIERVTDSFRPQFATTYATGMLLALSSMDNQIFPDIRTVTPSGTTAAQKNCIGIVAEEWASPNTGGFDGLGGLISAANSNYRATQDITVVKHGVVLANFDNTNAAAAAGTNGVAIQNSQNAAGKVQSMTASLVAGAILGYCVLPASGIGSSLGNGALTQASQTATVGGTPAAGDTLTVTIQVPYLDVFLNQNSAGTAQTRAVTATLATADAVSTTTAATKLKTVLNADGVFSKYYVATSSAAVVTVTVLGTAPLFNISWANGAQAKIGLSGTVGNSITFVNAATGGSTLTAGSSTLASGAGFVGAAPVYVSFL